AIRGVAQWTLGRSRVSDARLLPETTHNRTIPDGVYLRGVPAWHERTNWANKRAEMAAHAVGWLVGALLMDVVMEREPEGLGPVERSLWNIMLGVNVLFWVSSLARAVFTYFFNEPAKHANKFGIAASDVMVETIEKSAMDTFEWVLDQAGMQIASGHWGTGGEQEAARLRMSIDVLSGAVFRERPLRLPETLTPLVE